MLQYEPEAWRDQSAADPTAREQCRLLDLLGRINYRILSGNRVYVEVEGVVYKTITAATGAASSRASNTTCFAASACPAPRGLTRM